ncbi:diguanylate cyclase [Xanthomonas vasicola]|uniref:diguanylate cyclase n=1 Tax=Xanthomonas vasicola TaxID=56459 RepID=UPI001E367128|nr:diguanylate cyclase [Xanthomonas vasicola]MDO6984609.1 diguanylate cyclase [Xanthomonas vasicola]
MGLVVLDFDFKRLNDAHGHRVGNRALPIVSAVLKRNAHAADIAARRGGEELLVAFPGIFAQAFLATCNGLVQQIRAHPGDLANSALRLTVSFGGIHIERFERHAFGRAFSVADALP